MLKAEQIKREIDKLLEKSDSFLIEVMVKPGNVVEVFIDNDKGIVIDHCIDLSRALEEELNKITLDFELNVSSSGADSAVKQIRQMHKSIGKEFEAVRNDNTKFKAILTEVKENTFVFEWEERVKIEGKKGRKLQQFKKEFALADLKQVKRTISFK